MTQDLVQKARDNMHKPGYQNSALYARLHKIRKALEELEDMVEREARKELLR